MASEKEKEALHGSEEETTALKVGDKSADGSLPGMEDGDVPNDTFDNSRARFINSTNSMERPDGATPQEVYVDVEGKTKLEDNFVGLTKEELMKFADDPYWKKVRLVLLILFWVGWFAMLIAAIIIIVVAPKCPPRPKLDWWQKSAVYQVYPKSFKDTNADGVGDLKGIHENLNYLTGEKDSLNISAVYLNSIFPHGGTSGGYDVTDFVNISSEFGTMEDFKNLRVAMHKKNLKVILDFIPNHSGDKHPWFEKSRSGEEKYADYYVWRDGQNGATTPPNNWQSVQGGSAWTYDSTRGQFYLHQFSSSQPDLNLRNADVRQELEDTLQFWMDAGVDGFRINGASHLFECLNMTDEAKKDDAQDVSYDNLDHSCTRFQPESYEIITEWRKSLDKFGKKYDRVLMLFIESSGTVNQTAQFFTYEGQPGAHMVTNDVLTDIDVDCKAECILGKINSFETMASELNVWSNWQIGNHDSSRVVSRFSDRTMINAMNMLLLTLPGTSISYYGEEIGMHDTDSISVGQDERDKYRSPLQWSTEENAGFSDGNTTWVSIPDDYIHFNIKTQKAHGGGVSNLEVFTELVKIRDEPSFQWGDLQIGVTGNVLFYIRKATGFPRFLVAINFGPSSSTVDFVNNAPKDTIIPETGTVFATTANFPNSGDDFNDEKEADLSNLILAPAQGVVFKLVKEKKE